MGTTAESKKGKEDEDDDAEEQEESGGKPCFNSRILYLGYSEDSLTKRRKFSRGPAAIKQLEWCHVVSFASLCLPERPRQHYDGTNCGNALFNIHLPPLPGDEWHMDFKTKKECYGKKHRIDVGGKAEDQDENKAAERRTNDTREPFAYHSRLACGSFCEPTAHAVHVRARVRACSCATPARGCARARLRATPARTRACDRYAT